MTSGATFLQNFQHFSGKKYWKLWSDIALYHPHQPSLCHTNQPTIFMSHQTWLKESAMSFFLSFNTIFFRSSILFAASSNIPRVSSRASVDWYWLLNRSTLDACHHRGMLVTSIFMGSTHSGGQPWSANAGAISNWNTHAHNTHTNIYKLNHTILIVACLQEGCNISKTGEWKKNNFCQKNCNLIILVNANILQGFNTIISFLQI